MISSKVTFNYLLNILSAVDYSGVCLLVTKALEVEMSKRFREWYLTYLLTHYGNEGKPKKRQDYSKYPPVMLNQYGKPIASKEFTLGKVPFVLCSSESPKATEEEIKLNQDNLVSYAQEKLFNNLSNEEALDFLMSYGERVGEIAREYRNKAAHTNELKRVDAVNCFNLVIDVEKYLKIMLDSFNE